MNEELLIELNKNIEELKEKMEVANFNNRVAFNAYQAADYLSIGYDTLLRLRKIGDIEYAKNGTNYIFRKEHLDRWLDKQERRVNSGKFN